MSSQKQISLKVESLMAKIGIVGGGIAGMYCALHLLRRNHTVHLFEMLDHFGGRIETQDLSGFKAECGPMRFEKQIEPLFYELLKDLKIDFKLKQFTPTQPNPADFPKYDLAENEYSIHHHKLVEDAGSPIDHLTAAVDSHNTTSLDLLKYGIYRIFHDDPDSRALPLWEVVGLPGEMDKIKAYADTFEVNSDGPLDEIRTKKQLDGVLLYTLGFWNALSRVLSPGAISKIRDTGTFYHLMPENPNASEWSIFWLRLFMSKSDLWTIPEGVQLIVSTLQEELKAFKSRFVPIPKTCVTKVDTAYSSDEVVVTFETGKAKKTDVFEHVILAIPSVPMHRLAGNFPKNIQQHLSGVIPFTLLKAFVVIDEPWWDKLPDPQYGAHLIPTREIHYFPSPKKGENRAMVMFYTDRPATAYWQPFILKEHKRAQCQEPLELKRELALHLSQLLPRDGQSDSDFIARVENRIVDFAIRDWSREPFGAACHAWKPSINVPAALGDLKAFSTKRRGVKNIHVCGEAYSDYQGFIEGSLRSAKAVLDTI